MTASEIHLPAENVFDPTAGGASCLTAAWARHWRARPEAPAIHDPDRGWLSRGDLDRETKIRAGRLSALGLEAGDRVLLSAESSADLVTSYVAALRLGLVVIPTNTAYGSRELAHVIEDAGPQAAIVDDPDKRDALRKVARRWWSRPRRSRSRTGRSPDSMPRDRKRRR